MQSLNLKNYLKRYIGRALTYMPWAWVQVRWYVRHFPRVLVKLGIVVRVNDFFMNRNHRFVARTVYGYRIAGNTRDLIQRYLYLFGMWEPNLSSWFTQCLRRGDVVIDVGSNIGYFSLLASTFVGREGKVVAVEASTTIFEQLASNIALNSTENIRLVYCAASDRSGVLKIYRAPDSNLGLTSTFYDTDFQEDGEVVARPLSEILTTEEVQRARLIKIDVEGAEIAVVNGLLPLLQLARHDLELVVEVGGGPKGSPTAQESASQIVPLLMREGFNVYKIENDYNPSAYTATDPPARPKRVRDLSVVTQECDLIFSRCDTLVL